MKSRSLIESFNNAVNGIISTFRSERNMKIHIAAAVTVLGLSLFYDLTRLEFIIVCITVALVIICELFNTAIEVMIDTLIGIYHPRAKLVKTRRQAPFSFLHCCPSSWHISYSSTGSAQASNPASKG